MYPSPHFFVSAVSLVLLYEFPALYLPGEIIAICFVYTLFIDCLALCVIDRTYVLVYTKCRYIERIKHTI